MANYNHKKIESKWRKKWREEKLYRTEEDKKKKKFYALDMFPYPSGAGLHVGHPKGYIATDITARMKAMRGYSVLHPMGWDAFGLPAENYAIKNKIHPRAAVEENIKKFKKQLEKIGFTYDWEREINTTDPEYYRWTQWIFLKMFEKGLAYQSYEPINWCPGCQTGLANEDLEDGKCERCGSEVEKRPMRQWVLKMTAYADRLLEDLKLLDWDESIIEQQRNWIGRSEGATVKFRITNHESRIKVFTTRPDTLFGCTYMVLSPEHEMIKNHESRITNYEEVKKYVEKAKKKSDLDRTDLAKEKTGVELKGIKAINPVNNEEIPIWVADYVLSGYGTGAIMAVPAHDERDFEFARKYGLEIRQVVAPLFIGEGKNKIRKDKEYTKREVVDVIIKHWEKDEYFCLDWSKSKNDWKTFIVGGIEKGESAEEAALREAKEESGYQNMRVVKKIGNTIYSRFFAAHKDVNRHDLKRDCIYIELLDDSFIEPKEEEVKNHNGVWIKKEDVKDFINLPEIKVYWEIFLGEKNFNDSLIDKTKTPEQSAEDFGEPEDSHPRCRVQTCHSITSISDNKNVVKSKNSAEPAEGLEPSDLKMTSSGLHHIAGSSTPNVLYQNNKASVKEEFYTGDGVNINSGFLNGMETGEAKEKMIEWLEENNFGKKSVNYKMRDWVFSRQRYWGEPIPIIHCEKCGAVAVPENELPIKLPEVKNYEPTGTGESPLANIEEWVNTTCPKCGGAAKRETNTMPQWAGSSWYYLRYLDPKNKRELVDKEKEEYWMNPDGVDLYVGGAEHATRHLLYARFWHKFLYDIGVVSTLEPFHKLFYVGLILAADGRKMSKRWGNVINPDEIVEKYGADSLRLYEMFMGPFSQATAWNTNGLVGMSRFLEKIWGLNTKVQISNIKPISNDKYQDSKIERLLHKTIKKVTDDIESFKFNTAVSQLMILVNEMEKQEKISLVCYSQFLILLSPFAPHIAEELWEKLGNKKSVYLHSWPKYDPKLIEEEEVELVVQINGKLRDRIKIAADITEEDARKLVLESEKIKKWIEGKEIRKFIFVKGKLVNIVI